MEAPVRPHDDLCGVEQQPGRAELPTLPLVAGRARQQSDRRGGEGRQVVPARLDRPGGPQRQLVAAHFPVAIGHEHVVGRSFREGPLGHADDAEDIEVEADDVADPTDEHPAAEPRRLGSRRVQLRRQRGPEVGQAGPGPPRSSSPARPVSPSMTASRAATSRVGQSARPDGPPSSWSRRSFAHPAHPAQLVGDAATCRPSSAMNDESHSLRSAARCRADPSSGPMAALSRCPAA